VFAAAGARRIVASHGVSIGRRAGTFVIALICLVFFAGHMQGAFSERAIRDVEFSDVMLRFSCKCSADQYFLDIASAFINLTNPYVSVNALYRKICQVAIAAVNLYRVTANLLRHFTRK
jgi:hypothetical protein